MKKPTISTQNDQLPPDFKENAQTGVNQPNRFELLQEAWTPFNHENPDLEPGIYWAIGQRQDHRLGGQGLFNFQILIEVFSQHHAIKVMPTAATTWPQFLDCLPHVTHVHPLFAPLNPYTGTEVHKEYL